MLSKPFLYESARSHLSLGAYCAHRTSFVLGRGSRRKSGVFKNGGKYLLNDVDSYLAETLLFMT